MSLYNVHNRTCFWTSVSSCCIHKHFTKKFGYICTLCFLLYYICTFLPFLVMLQSHECMESRKRSPHHGMQIVLWYWEYDYTWLPWLWHVSVCLISCSCCQNNVITGFFPPSCSFPPSPPIDSFLLYIYTVQCACKEFTIESTSCSCMSEYK